MLIHLALLTQLLKKLLTPELNRGDQTPHGEANIVVTCANRSSDSLPIHRRKSPLSDLRNTVVTANLTVFIQFTIPDVDDLTFTDAFYPHAKKTVIMKDLR